MLLSTYRLLRAELCLYTVHCLYTVSLDLVLGDLSDVTFALKPIIQQ